MPFSIAELKKSLGIVENETPPLNKSVRLRSAPLVNIVDNEASIVENKESSEELKNDEVASDNSEAAVDTKEKDDPETIPLLDEEESDYSDENAVSENATPNLGITPSTNNDQLPNEGTEENIDSQKAHEEQDNGDEVQSISAIGEVNDVPKETIDDSLAEIESEIPEIVGEEYPVQNEPVAVDEHLVDETLPATNDEVNKVDSKEQESDTLLNGNTEPSSDAINVDTEPSSVAVNVDTEPSKDAVNVDTEPSSDAVNVDTEPSNDAVNVDTETSSDAVNVDTEPSSDAVNVDTEPSSVAVNADTEPSSDAINVDTEPSSVAVNVDTEPSSDSVNVDTEPSSDAVSVDTEPTSDAVNVDTEPSSVAVNADTEPSSDVINVDTEPSNDAVSVDTEPTNDAVSVDTEPTNDAVSVDTEPSNDAVNVDTEPSNDAVSVDTEPTNDAVSVDTEPTNDAVSVDTELTNDAVSVDTEPTNDAVSVDTEPTNDVVSVDTEPSNDAVRVDTEPSKDAVSVDTEPTNDAVSVDTEPINDAVSVDTEPTNDAVSVDTEPSSDAVNVDAEPSSDAVNVDTEPPNDTVNVDTEPPNDAVNVDTEPPNDAVNVDTEPQNDAENVDTEPLNVDEQKEIKNEAGETSENIEIEPTEPVKEDESEEGVKTVPLVLAEESANEDEPSEVTNVLDADKSPEEINCSLKPEEEISSEVIEPSYVNEIHDDIPEKEDGISSMDADVTEATIVEELQEEVNDNTKIEDVSETVDTKATETPNVEEMTEELNDTPLTVEESVNQEVNKITTEDDENVDQTPDIIKDTQEREEQIASVDIDVSDNGNATHEEEPASVDVQIIEPVNVDTSPEDVNDIPVNKEDIASVNPFVIEPSTVNETPEEADNIPAFEKENACVDVELTETLNNDEITEDVNESPSPSDVTDSVNPCITEALDENETPEEANDIQEAEYVNASMISDIKESLDKEITANVTEPLNVDKTEDEVNDEQITSVDTNIIEPLKTPEPIDETDLINDIKEVNIDAAIIEDENVVVERNQATDNNKTNQDENGVLELFETLINENDEDLDTNEDENEFKELNEEEKKEFKSSLERVISLKSPKGNAEYVDIDLNKDSKSSDEDKCTEIDIEEAIKNAGACGKFQCVVQIVLTYLVMTFAFQATFSYFIANDPPWKCTKITKNSTSFCQKNIDKNFSSDNKLFSKRCDLKRSEWTYTTDKTYSFVTEYDLVCKKSSIAALASAIYHLGGAAGIFIAGMSADYLGRKYVLMAALTILTAISIGGTYVTNAVQIIVLRAFIGACTVSCYNVSYNYLSELVSPNRRTLAAIIFGVGFASSQGFVSVAAYFSRHWRSLQRFASLPAILGIILMCLLPESPRWQLAKQKQSKAEKTMKKIGKYNGHPIPDVSLKMLPVVKSTNYTYLDLVKNCKVFTVTILQAFMWMTIEMCYYTIALQSSNLGGDMYKAFGLSLAAELPSKIVACYTCIRFGRKKSVLIALFFTGVSLIGTLLVPHSYSHRFLLNMVMMMFAKFFVDIGEQSVYMWTFELFPTVLRLQGTGVCVISARLGAFAAPFLTTTLQQANPSLPYIILAAFAFSAAGCGCFLPETHNKPLRENYEDFFEKPVEVEGKDNEVTEV